MLSTIKVLFEGSEMITTKDSAQDARQATADLAVEVTPRKSLKTLAKIFCEDANKDPIHYLIRSNTTHDGE